MEFTTVIKSESAKTSAYFLFTFVLVPHLCLLLCL